MIKQFLLNEDGTIPEWANLAALEAEGVPLVLPTPRWTPQPGYALEERDPEQDADGVWRQVWVETIAPEQPEAAVAEPDDLASLVATLLERVAELEGR